MDNLATELIEIIIDHLHDDNPSLAACALVCRAFVPASRYHLFVSISARFTFEFIAIITSKECTFLRFVREATVTMWNASDAESLSPFLSSISSISTLTICLDMHGPVVFRGNSNLRFPQVTKLQLRGRGLEWIYKFSSLLSLFPSLRQLAINGLDWSGQIQNSISDYCFPSTMKELRLRSDPSDLLVGLIVMGLFTDLHILRIEVGTRKALVSLGIAIRHLKANLNVLELMISDDEIISLGRLFPSVATKR